MPKTTFMNLPKDKQQSILNAAILEFSRTTLGDASINKIIKESNIPRGSFYMYFDSKEDLYYFLVEKLFSFIFAAKHKLLKKNNGNLVNTYISLFDIVYRECTSKSRIDFFRNVFINMNYQAEKEFFTNREYIINKIDDYFNDVDTSVLNVHDNHDLFLIDETFMSILMHSIFESFKFPLEDVKKNYYKKIALFKNGIYIKEDVDA